MKTAFDTGLNRTGAAASPVDSPKMIQGAEQGASLVTGRPEDLRAARADYAREAEPIGHVPPPASVKGAVKTALKALQGDKANVFIDKLGERLAFERTGVRLYELALTKADVYPSWEGGPGREDLLAIQRDELAHFGLLQRCLEKLGADPTAMTPSANLAANISKGVPAVLADPRTDLRQCLEALLVAELSDNACWETLVALARDAGEDDMAADFEQALRAEALHLSRVKAWLERGTLAAAHGRGTEAAPRAARQPRT
jgi:ferritin-like protein